MVQVGQSGAMSLKIGETVVWCKGTFISVLFILQYTMPFIYVHMFIVYFEM